MHRPDPSALIQILDNLRSDIHELRRVNIVYRSSGHSEVQLRALDPYTLVYRWGGGMSSANVTYASKCALFGWTGLSSYR